MVMAGFLSGVGVAVGFDPYLHSAEGNHDVVAAKAGPDGAPELAIGHPGGLPRAGEERMQSVALRFG